MLFFHFSIIYSHIVSEAFIDITPYKDQKTNKKATLSAACSERIAYLFTFIDAERDFKTARFIHQHK
ncbi:hypothetical protein C6W24_09670 [Bacillus atrophaeus]|nr:hypothetical protein C6W24_09670 [Bacillus atrophaeus]